MAWALVPCPSASSTSSSQSSTRSFNAPHGVGVPVVDLLDEGQDEVLAVGELLGEGVVQAVTGPAGDDRGLRAEDHGHLHHLDGV